MKNNKKNITAIIILLAVVLLTCGGFWYKNKMARVAVGTAHPYFPYSDRTLAELEALYPQYVENTVVTTQTPEETYAKLVEALKKENFNEAVANFVPEQREKMKTFFQNLKTQGLLSQAIEDLTREFTKESMDSYKAVYSFAFLKDGEKFGRFVNFIKNEKGVWLIESI